MKSDVNVTACWLNAASGARIMAISCMAIRAPYREMIVAIADGARYPAVRNETRNKQVRRDWRAWLCFTGYISDYYGFDDHLKRAFPVSASCCRLGMEADGPS